MEQHSSTSPAHLVSLGSLPLKPAHGQFIWFKKELVFCGRKYKTSRKNTSKKFSVSAITKDNTK